MVLPQNKTKISAVITSKAFSELVLKKVSSFEIRGKDFTVFLNAKNIKALNKLVKTKVAFKATKLKNGKIKLEVLVNGKKLSAKQLAKETLSNMRLRNLMPKVTYLRTEIWLP